MPSKRLADVSLTILQALSYGFFSYAVSDFNKSPRGLDNYTLEICGLSCGSGMLLKSIVICSEQPKIFMSNIPKKLFSMSNTF